MERQRKKGLSFTPPGQAKTTPIKKSGPGCEVPEIGQELTEIDETMITTGTAAKIAQEGSNPVNQIRNENLEESLARGLDEAYEAGVQRLARKAHVRRHEGGCTCLGGD